MNKLLLIDGNAMMHRAYHALPPLTNTAGEPVHMVYGFFSMLLNVLIDQEPTHLVVCFDRGAPTIRQSMYANYKFSNGLHMRERICSYNKSGWAILLFNLFSVFIKC